VGVIASLTAGFEALNRKLWLLLIPIGLDLVLWCGPQVSVAPIVRRAAALWLTSPAANSFDQQQIVALRQALEGLARSFNLFALLSLAVPGRDVAVRLFTNILTNVLGVPALNMTRDEALAPAPIRVSAIELSDPWALFVVATLLLLLGVLLSAVFLSLVAQIVRDGEVQVPTLLRCIGPNAIHLAAYLLLGVGLLVLVALPFLFLAMPLLLTVPTTGALLVTMPWLWVGFYLFFAPAAIFVSEVNPIRAVWYSFNVMRVDPWRALGLILCISAIQAGLPMLWQQITAWPWGVLVGTVGNAYVGAGLTAAALIFYRDRYRQWQELVMAAGPR